MVLRFLSSTFFMLVFEAGCGFSGSVRMYVYDTKFGWLVLCGEEVKLGQTVGRFVYLVGTDRGSIVCMN
jgi:hypothetical protein